MELISMASVDIIKTIFQSRKPLNSEGVTQGEYIWGIGHVGIIDVGMLRENANQYRRFSRYLCCAGRQWYVHCIAGVAGGGCTALYTQ